MMKRKLKKKLTYNLHWKQIILLIFTISICLIIIASHIYTDLKLAVGNVSEDIFSSSKLKNFSLETEEFINRRTFLVPEKNCSSPFMSIADGGRFGNNVCKFMALYLFRIEFGIRVIVSGKTDAILRRVFSQVPSPRLPSTCFNTKSKSYYQDGFDIMYKHFSESMTDFNIPWKRKLNQTNISHFNFILSYPCPIGHVMEYRDLFRSLLKVKKNLIEKASHLLKRSLKDKKLNLSDITLIGVHIRRSDYLNYVRNTKVVYHTEAFFKNAIEFYRRNCNNAVFVVVSDDLKWSKERFSASDVVFPGNGNIDSPEIDFVLLTLCHHHIRGLGTYGGTSAFLAKGSAVIFRYRYKQAAGIGKTSYGLMEENINCSSSSEFYYVDL
ncbi:UNVERIFIED_CONTAM: hypothetical protein RMT77_003024 [Armadillidium vulgare]